MKRMGMAYGQALFELQISDQSIQEAEKLLDENKRLIEVLENPTIPQREKENVIDVIFSAELGSFFKIICRNGNMGCWKDAFTYFKTLKRRDSKTVKALMVYVELPNKAQQMRIEKYLKKRYQAEQVELELKQDTSLMGGFILKVQDDVMDHSLKGKLMEMKQTLMWR